MTMSGTPCRSLTRFFRGCDLHWQEWAPRAEAKRPVVLVHGLSDSCRTWSHIAPALANERRVYALDLPGHGFSNRPDVPYEIGWYAGVVSDWIRSLGLEDVDLIGHSLGGGIAMRVLLERPARVGRLGLVSAGGLGLEIAMPLRIAAVTGMLELTAPLLMGVGTRAGIMVLGGNFDPQERRHLARVNAFPGTARALFRTLRGAVDLKGQREHLLDHAHCMADLPPVAVYWGENDPVIPVRHADEVQRYLEGVTVRRFAKVGHYPHREAVSEMLPALVRFLDEPQAPPRLRPGVRSPRAVLEARTSFWRRLPGARFAPAD
jgi:pimeloyl-ACP methyl ester carboxylesterase